VKTQTVNEFQEFALKNLKLKAPWLLLLPLKKRNQYEDSPNSARFSLKNLKLKIPDSCLFLENAKLEIIDSSL
jgi:hypothetical protein